MADNNDKVEAKAEEAKAPARETNESALARAIEQFSVVLDRQTPSSMPAGPDPRFFNTKPGGEFLYNGFWVDANGNPIQVNAEKQKLAEDERKRNLAARRMVNSDMEMDER